jgi:hypothetical protein
MKIKYDRDIVLGGEHGFHKEEWIEIECYRCGYKWDTEVWNG